VTTGCWTGSRGVSSVESVEWFAAWADYVATAIAWPKLTEEQKQTIDYVRVANDMRHTVEVGHELLKVSIPLELEEIKSVYALSHGGKIDPKGFRAGFERQCRMVALIAPMTRFT